jgi:hypothetical protein
MEEVRALQQPKFPQKYGQDMEPGGFFLFYFIKRDLPSNDVTPALIPMYT